MQKAAIIGGGLIGRLMALSLLRQGDWQISLFEPLDLLKDRSTGHVAGGMIVPTLELEEAEYDVWRLGQYSVSTWQKMLAELQMEDALSVQGSLVACFENEKAQFLDLSRKVSFKLGSEPFRRLDASELREKYPALNHRLHAAWYVPGEAHLNNERVMDGLATALLRHPNFRQISEYADEQKISDLSARHELLIDCRGIGGTFFGEAVRAVRGEILRVFMANHGLTLPVRLVHPRFPIYVVPKSKDLLTIGATAFESDHAGPVTVRSSLELMSSLYSLLPASGEAEILRMEIGFRSAYKNNFPKIVKKQGKTGSLYVLNGFYRHGFLLGPVFCAALLDEILGEKSLESSIVASHCEVL